MKITFSKLDKALVIDQLIEAGIGPDASKADKILSLIELAFEQQLEEEIEYMIEYLENEVKV